MWLELLPNLLAATLVAGFSLVLGLRPPPRPVWPVLLWYQLLVLLYLIGDGITLVSQDMFWEQIGIAVLYSGSLPAASACWLLVLRYAEAEGHPYRWVRGPVLWAPVAFSVLGWAVMLTNPWHGQFLVPVIGAHNEHLWAWEIFVPAGYYTVWASVALLLGLVLRARDWEVRRNALIMSAGIVATLVVNFISYTPPYEVPFDLTVLGLGLSSSIFLFGAYRTRLFKLLPVALREIAQHETDGVLLVDREGRLVYANPAAAEMFALASVGAMPALPGLFARRLRDSQRRASDGEELLREILTTPFGVGCDLGEVQLIDGRWVHLTATRIPDRVGRGTLALRLHDVTSLREMTARLAELEERGRLEERIHHAERLESLGVLAGGIAHDFNNLLSVIAGNAHMALRDVDRPDQLRVELQRILEAGRFASELTDQMLTTAGKRETRFQVVEPSQLIAETLSVLRGSLSAKCEIEMELEPKPPIIDADATQVRQVVMNLVRNAAEALGPEGGRVEVLCRGALLGARELEACHTAGGIEPGPALLIEVRDTGEGMSEDSLRHLFEPFHSTKEQGRGLGLAAVNGIVRAHGGAIRVESSPGEGCRFRVFFPLARERETTRLQRRTEHRAAAPAIRGRVLVVDDDASVLELTTLVLERAGFEAVPARNGTEALALFDASEAPFCAVVLDLEMPEMDGGQTLRSLRDRSATLGIVVMSGYGRGLAEERFGALDAADAFLSKPYEPEDLEAAVVRLLERDDAAPDSSEADHAPA